MNKTIYILPLLLIHQASVSAWTWHTTGNVTTDWAEKHEARQRQQQEVLNANQQESTRPQSAPKPDVITVPVSAQQPAQQAVDEESPRYYYPIIEHEEESKETTEILQPNTGYSFRKKALMVCGLTISAVSLYYYLKQ